MTHLFHTNSSKHISHVYIQVVDLTRMVDFYHDVLGFDVLSKSHHRVVLGMKQEAMITLLYSSNTQLETQVTQGLYHVAYLVPNKDDFASFLRFISTLDIPLDGFADHGVSQAIYLRDPEGNGIEIYMDRNPQDWPHIKGQLHMVSDPLDVRALLQLSKEERKLPSTTILGHLHLHVDDLIKSIKFYEETLGYKVRQRVGSQVAFLSDGMYHHHLGINTWNGRKIPKKNKKTSGLIGYRIHHVNTLDEEDPSGLVLNPNY